MLLVIKNWRHLKHDINTDILTPLGKFYPFAFSKDGKTNDVEIFEISKTGEIHNHHSISRIKFFKT